MSELRTADSQVSPAEIRLAVEWLAANANGVSLVDWEPRSQTLLGAADEIESLRQFRDWAEPQIVTHGRDVVEIEKLRAALESLYPGLVLDLRYADDTDDKDAMRSRIKTVEEALSP